MPTMVKGKRLLDDEEATLAERRRLTGEIRALTTAHEKELPRLNAAVAAAWAQVEEARETLKEAEKAYRATLGPRSVASLRFSRQRDILEGRLRDTAPPEIDEFIDGLQAETARLQLAGHPDSVATRQARIAGLWAARLAAEGLRVQALSRSELVKRLDAIREGVDDEVVA